MAVSYDEVAALLHDRLRISGENAITVPWPEFYRMNGVDKWRPERFERVRKLCLDDHGIIFSCGNRVVVAARDSNFAGG